MSLQAGVGTRDITPPVGTPLAGRPTKFPSRRINDPLHVKAVYFEQGDGRAMLLSVDLVLLMPELASEMRGAIANRLSMPIEAVVLCTTHTHSGPGVGEWASWGGHDVYEADLRRKVVEAAQDAQRAAGPASLFYAAGRWDDQIHNRRWVMADGSVATHPRRDGAQQPDGPIDPEVQAVLVRGGNGRPAAVLVGFACHPTAMGPAEGAISADYPHWIESEVKQAFGEQAEMLFFAGALGDVSDGEPFKRPTGTEMAAHIGRGVGQAAVRSLETGAVEITGNLSTGYAAVSVPTVDMGPARRRWAEDVLKAPESRPSWQVRDARMVQEMWQEWPDEIDTGVPLVAIGDLAFYGIPGELTCWYGLQLKAQSRFRYPFVLGLANGRIGYIADRVFPTKDMFNVPLDFAHRRFGEHDDAGERIVRAALGM